MAKKGIEKPGKDKGLAGAVTESGTGSRGTASTAGADGQTGAYMRTRTPLEKKTANGGQAQTGAYMKTRTPLDKKIDSGIQKPGKNRGNGRNRTK